jgi:malate dehydrogenase (oxaloacetate-decarboxylating)
MAETINEKALKIHLDNKGKIDISSKIKIKTNEELSLLYTPGVAEPCRRIAKNPNDIYKYTSKGNIVAVVTDGSAVLGLGNIGAKAGLPVMEGKSILFKEFAGVDSFPILIESQDTETIINTVKQIAGGFGGINLEDISAPRCFEIEERLKKELDIPVFHDDQHGTAIVTLAGLINACKITSRDIKNQKIVMIGAGAAGVAITKLLQEVGVNDILVLDSKGAIYEGREDIANNKTKLYLSKTTNKEKLTGKLDEMIKNRDVFIGVSAANLLTQDMVKTMNKDPIIFALANPEPEILPNLAKEAGAKIIATGRSDFPNQINNVLGFPNIFRGAFDARASDINKDMILAAAYALAKSVKNPTVDKIIPDPFEIEYRTIVAKAVYDAAIKSGVSRLDME